MGVPTTEASRFCFILQVVETGVSLQNCYLHVAGNVEEREVINLQVIWWQISFLGYAGTDSEWSWLWEINSPVNKQENGLISHFIRHCYCIWYYIWIEQGHWEADSLLANQEIPRSSTSILQEVTTVFCRKPDRFSANPGYCTSFHRLLLDIMASRSLDLVTISVFGPYNSVVVRNHGYPDWFSSLNLLMCYVPPKWKDSTAQHIFTITNTKSDILDHTKLHRLHLCECARRF